MLHHGPTKGGKLEAVRFHDQYQYTLDLYAEVFNETPPSDIWPSVEKRFSPMDYKRIDVTKNIILNKKKVKEYMISYALPIVGALLLSLFTFSTETKPKEDDNFWWWVLGIGIAIFIIRGIYRYVNKDERRSRSSSSSSSTYDSGCSVVGSFFGCGSSDSSSSSSSGCGSSGCGSSGCGSSGCGGCGGGGCGS